MRKSYKWLLVIALFPQLIVASELFRWIDKDGQVHYGDKVPAASVNDGHVKLNNAGVVVEKTAAAKTEQELKEAQWLEELEAQKSAKRAAKDRRDRHLLDTYTTLAELDVVYLKRLEQLEVNNEQLKTLRDKYLLEVMEFKKKLAEATEVDERIKLEKFSGISKESLEIYQKALEKSTLEERSIMAEYLKDKQRLEELLAAEDVMDVNAADLLKDH